MVRRQLAPTPLVEAGGLLLKLDSLQPTGSFKVRGALAALAMIEPGSVVITASAGNHGLGIAHAASRLGRRAVVVVPETVASAKLAGLRRLGVETLLHGRGYDEAEARAIELAGQRGWRFVSAYNDPLVIAGQASLAAELLEQLDGRAPLVLCPVGGGGLASGIALWFETAAPEAVLVGVEAEASAALAAAFAAARIDPDFSEGPTVADGLAGSLEPGSVTFEILHGRLRHLVAVSEPEIHRAMAWLATGCGLVAEGAGATATAAWLAGQTPEPDGRPVVSLVTGRNLSPARLAEALANPGRQQVGAA